MAIYTMGRRKLGAVLLLGCVLALMTVATPLVGAVGAAVDDPDRDAGETATDEPIGTADTIHPDLQNASGSQEVIVRLAPRNGASVTSQGAPDDRVQAMKQSAANAQHDVVALADTSEDVSIESRFWLANAVLVEVDADSGALEQLASLDVVDRVHPNYDVQAQSAASAEQSDREKLPASTADDSAANATYGLELVNATDVWKQYDTRGEGTSVAVLDTGVDPDHPDIDLFTENASDPTYPGGWAAFDAQGNRIPDSQPYDGTGHGTHVAGTVAGGAASGRHIGVAPNTTLLAAKALDDTGYGSYARIVASMEWAVEQDADVLSMSLGQRGQPPEYVEPVRNAQAAGSVVVGVTGRFGPETSVAPGNVYGATAVGAIDSEHAVLPSSGGQVVETDEWGPSVPDEWPTSYVVPDVVAPGEGVYSAAPGGGYVLDRGTSMATPHVSGTIALLESIAGDRSPTVLQQSIVETAWKPDDAPDEDDPRYGAGVVDALAAAAYLQDASVRGTVTSQGEPLADAVVETQSGVRTRTDTDGSFELPLAPGNYTLHVDGFGAANDTVAVTVPESGFVEQSIELDAAAEVETVSAQPTVVEAGDTVTAEYEVTDVDEFTPRVNGSYPAENLSVSADGTDAVKVSIETEDGVTGEVELELVLDGPDGTSIHSAGSTTVVERIEPVAVVGINQYRTEHIASTLEAELPPAYQTERVAPANASERLPEFDAAVVQHLGDATTADQIVTAADEHDVGLVLLEQWGNESDGVSQVAAATGWPGGTGQSDDGLGPVEYTIERNHPILDGVGAAGDTVPVHSGQYADLAWIRDSALATVLASVGDQAGVSGPALAVDDDRKVVLAASLGRTQFARDRHYSNASNRILGNAVAYVADDRSAEWPQATVTVDDAAIPIGQTRTVSIETNARGVAGYQTEIEFDPSVLSVVDVHGGDFSDPVVNVDADAGTVRIAQANASATDTPELATVEFGAGNQTDQSTPVRPVASQTELTDVSGERIDAGVDAGTVEVLDCLSGDLNDDGRVTVGDATLTLRHVVGLPVQEFDERCADLTGDGHVTTADATHILRAVVGLDDGTTATEA